MAAVIELLEEVLEVHAKIRPDIFIPGTTKYTEGELLQIFADDNRPVFVAVNDKDEVLGYAFCEYRKQPFSNNMIPFTSLFIDDLCVNEKARGQKIGEALINYVKETAKAKGCYEVTLNVWEGNDSARGFYDHAGFKVKESQMEFILK